MTFIALSCRVFDIYEPDEELLNSLPEFKQAQIRATAEYNKAAEVKDMPNW